MQSLSRSTDSPSHQQFHASWHNLKSYVIRRRVVFLQHAKDDLDDKFVVPDYPSEKLKTSTAGSF